VKALVTGGAGYIGSIVALQLIRAGHEVAVLDDISKGHRAAVPGGVEDCIEADLLDVERISRVLSRGYDGVLHFAALNLLEAMRTAGVSRLVFSSTAAVYGEPEEVPILETTSTVPTNPYGGSKLAADQLIGFFADAHGLRATSLRYFNVAGASGDLGEDHDPETHLIPLILEAALGQRENVRIFGTDYATPDGTAVRDYIHVEDLGRAHLLALEATDGADNGEHRIYNLGNGAGFSVREVVEAARRVTGRTIKAIESPRRAGDPPVLVASSDRIRAELGWMPEKPSLEAMISDAWEWTQKHPQGYDEG
jgi:UDP-glucose 4-epimerase